MSPTVPLIVTVLALVSAERAAPKHEKSDKHHSCQEFTQGLSFNDTQAVGTWHLLLYRNEKNNGSGDMQCVQFTPVNNQDRKELQDRIGKYVENLKWEKLTLRMQIPCTTGNSNKTGDYYLEKLEGDGSYRILQRPPLSAKLDLAEFQRYTMRLKVIEDEYLGMMDCREKFVFIFGKQPPEGTDIDDRVKKIMEVYWPEDN